MNIKVITNKYFLEKLVQKYAHAESTTIEQQIKALSNKRQAKREAINSLVDLNYSFSDCMNIVDHYWPKNYIEYKKKHGIDNESINEMSLEYGPESDRFRTLLINRYIIACAELEDAIEKSTK